MGGDGFSGSISAEIKKEEVPKKRLELVVNRAKTNIRGWEKRVNRR